MPQIKWLFIPTSKQIPRAFSAGMRRGRPSSPQPLMLRWQLGGFIVLLLLLPLLGAGCNWGIKRPPVDGGVWRSDDSGSNWQQKVFVAQQNKKTITIANVDIKSLVFSQADTGLLVASGGAAGLLLTSDRGEHWRQVFNAEVTALALHPQQAGTIFVASTNRIYHTDDSGGSWSNIYLDTTPEVLITSLAIDAADNKVVYAATSRGVLLRSLDSGSTWQQVYLFKGDVSKILLSPLDSKVIYIAQSDGRLWRSADRGASWRDLSSLIKEQTSLRSGRYQSLLFAGAAGEDLLYATQSGLLFGTETGQKWRELKLVTPPGALAITALAVNPKKNNQLIYATANNLYYSSDSGSTWQTKLLPSRRAVSAVVINPNNDKQIYLGFSRK